MEMLQEAGWKGLQRGIARAIMVSSSPHQAPAAKAWSMAHTPVAKVVGLQKMELGWWKQVPGDEDTSLKIIPPDSSLSLTLGPTHIQ